MHVKFRAGAFACGLALATVSSASLAQYSNMYVFGDSLSDVGAYTSFSVGVGMLPSTAMYKFTNNVGNVWDQNLAAKMGMSVSTAYQLNLGTAMFDAIPTGNGFAVGGARVSLVPGVFPASPAIEANIPSVNAQVTALLARGALDGGALYTVWAGANDIFTQMGLVGASAITVPTAQTALTTAAAGLAAEVARLKAAGAKNILVLNVPDIGTTPYAATLGPTGQGLATLLSATYNAALAQAISGQGALFLDTSKILASIIANPAQYGITPGTGTTIPACGAAPSSIVCIAAANGALFADGVHPTTLGHQLIADWVYGMLQATAGAATGATISNMAVLVPLGRSGAEWRTVDSRLRSFQNFGGQGARMFAAGDYADASSNAPSGSKAATGSTWTGTVGYERTLSANTLVGGTLGLERARFDMVNNAGRLDYDETMLTLYFSHKFDERWYLNGLASYGTLDFDTLRNITGLPITERASFGGSHQGVKFQVGYLMRDGGYTHGPFGGLDWESAKIDAFSEGASATAISVGAQTVRQAHVRIGYEVAGETTLAGTPVRPYAQISYDNQYLKDNRTFVAGVTGSLLPITTQNKTGGYARIALGLSAKVSKDMDLSVGFSTTSGNPAGRDTALNVVLSSAF